MVGIIGAMEEEVRELIEDMTECEMQEKASMKFYKGQLYGKEAVVVQSGIGKVNAGICTQILIDFYQVDQLINTGVAGSLDAEINIGDIVVSTDAVEHDMDVSALGDPVGQVPRMDVFAFPADKELVRKAVEANKKANSDIRTFTGRVASGDQFISEKEVKERIVNNFGAKCAEMEGAAIAQVCQLDNVPFIVIRGISDSPNGNNEITFEKYLKKASQRCANIIDKFM